MMDEMEEREEERPKEVKLKSEMYNHDNEQLVRREEDEEPNEAVMWGFVLGFILFFIILIIIICFTNR